MAPKIFKLKFIYGAHYKEKYTLKKYKRWTGKQTNNKGYRLK